MLNTHYFIYCSQRISFNESREIARFDTWLKQVSDTLYNSVSDKFPYITYYRSVNFLFNSLGSKVFRKIANRLASRVESTRKGESRSRKDL